LTTKVVLRDSQGKNIGLVGIGRDITTLKQAERELRHSNEELERRVEERTAEIARQAYILDVFMDNIPDNIYFKDLDSRITRVNRAHALHFGFSDPSEEIGKSDFDFFQEEQARPRFEQEQEIIRTGQPILNSEESDGIGHWLLTTKMPLRDEKGEIIGTFGISSDITELVKSKQAAEAAVDEADKARALAEIEKEKAEAAKNEAEKAHHDMEIANQTLAAQMWQTAGQALLNEKMRGEQDIHTLANNVINQLCDYLDVQIGALYVMEKDVLKVVGTYAYIRKNLAKEFRLGEGLVGQAALNKLPITVDVPEDYTPIASLSLGKMVPKHILFIPLVYDEQTIGVAEMGKLAEFTPAQVGFLEKAIESVAIAFMTAQARARVNELFSQTRQQAEELQSQEEELRAANEELEAQTESLRASKT
jgi:PAS domain S-box-containing protein